MSFDQIARRGHGIVVTGLLGAAAYFQASGVVELVGAKVLAVEPASVAAGVGRGSRAAKQEQAPERAASGLPVLARNPFDSQTGPLDREPVKVELPASEQEHKKVDMSDPLNAQLCSDVTVTIVSESGDNRWSSAHLRGPSEEVATMRRVGDQVGTRKVVYVGFNANRASPAVWLLGDEGLCQALLFAPEEENKDKDKAGSKRAAAAPPPPPPPPPSAAKPQRGTQVPPEIADKIQKVSETEFVVERAVIDNILENQAQLMRSARIVPEQQDGKTVGIRLFGIRSDTLLGTLGLENGDRLEKINGFEMAAPEKALEAYARLRTASKLAVEITRRGKPMTLEFRIQ